MIAVRFNAWLTTRWDRRVQRRIQRAPRQIGCRPAETAVAVLVGNWRATPDFGLVRLERGERGRITSPVIHDRVELDLPLT